MHLETGRRADDGANECHCKEAVSLMLKVFPIAKSATSKAHPGSNVDEAFRSYYRSSGKGYEGNAGLRECGIAQIEHAELRDCEMRECGIREAARNTTLSYQISSIKLDR
jgi:hypothetical protein